MKVRLISCSQPIKDSIIGLDDVQDLIAYCARVSNPDNQLNSKTSDKLLNYLAKHKHWSPFEHASMTLEIDTSKAIGIQLIRHRSFTFQEFSQRYQDVNLLGEDMFEPIELRRQAEDNRQSSTQHFDPDLTYSYYLANSWPVNTMQDPPINRIASAAIDAYLEQAKQLYTKLLESGVARETARMILPLCTKTKIYMTGTLRSWIHFFDLRDDGHAQKEIQEIAKEGKEIFKQQFPVLSNALGYKDD